MQTMAPNSCAVQQVKLSPEEILLGYNAVKKLYPHIPPLSMWRACEYAAYGKLSLPEPALDLGCGDGAYFRLIWPEARDVTGVDASATVVQAARDGGVYRAVHHGPAHRLPFPDGSFASVFANCSLEHMDQLPVVLAEARRVLREDGVFIASVVTDRTRPWLVLPELLAAAGASVDVGEEVWRQYRDFHHLVNPLSAMGWMEQLSKAGLMVDTYIPIAPAGFAHVFHLLDVVWQQASPHFGKSLGEVLGAWAAGRPGFPEAFGQMVEGLAKISAGEEEWAGAVFVARSGPVPSRPAPGPVQAGVAPSPARTGKTCWCGNGALHEFSDDYLRCPDCETLVLSRWPDDERFVVANDTSDFYGEGYYKTHVVQDYGLPSLEQRSRQDLPERCMHWLRTVLKYIAPPAKTLELGCAHGGFVAMMRQAGFDATGLEMSPALVRRAQEMFQVPILQGRVEDQNIEAGSLDLLLHFDVLEHLPDPRSTMRHCLDLLKPGGIMIVQTPCYPEGTGHLSMVEGGNRFLEQLKPQEHLYLFSRTSIRRFFEEIGAPHLVFEPAVFAHYDMFFVVSRSVIQVPSTTVVTQALMSTAGGRLALAALDLDQRYRMKVDDLQRLADHHETCEMDRAARLKALLETDSALKDVQYRYKEQTGRLRETLAELKLQKQRLRDFKAQVKQKKSSPSAPLRWVSSIAKWWRSPKGQD